MLCVMLRNFFHIHKEEIGAQTSSFTLQQRRYMLTFLNTEIVENDFDILYVSRCVSCSVS